MNEKPKRNRFTITLHNIDIDSINEKYGFSKSMDDTTTKITELCGTTTQKTMIFFGASKQLHKCNISMIDHSNNEDIIQKNYNCYWCRNPFKNVSIGCPITHNPSKITLTYKSIINGNDYTIKEDMVSMM